MKIVIVAPKFTAAKGDFYQFPLGLGYISAVLKKAGHNVHCLNLNHHNEETESLVERVVREFKPDVCATGGLSPFMPNIQKIFRAARRARPEIFNIAGGGALSSDPEAGPLVMDIDAGVIGEGEETVVDLVATVQRGGDLSKVLGIVYRDATGKIRRTPVRPSIHDLASVPWPDYEGFGFGDVIDLQRPTDNYFFHTKDRPRSIDMITSRSCPYRCTFCFHPTGKVYRERPLDDFFAELDTLVARYRINMVAIIDELFSLKKQRLLEFCERIEPYGLQWMVQLHTNCADDYILDAMKKAGCSYISYGIEAMSQPILISMQKKSRKPRIEKVLLDTYERKIGIQGNLIFGDTNETLETANESMDWWANNRRYMINTNRLQVYPGSPDYIQAVRDGLINDRVDYIKSQFVDLNISKMNEDDLSILATKIWTAQSSLLLTAEPTRFEPEPEPDPIRGALHRIAWDCPRCEHHNDYRGVILERPLDEPSLRLTCRGCHARYDIPNKLYPGYAGHPGRGAADAKFAEVQALIAAGRRNEIPPLLHAIVGDAPWHWPAQIELGRFYQSVNAMPSAIRHISAAVQCNPYEAECHVAYAEILIQERTIGLAIQHLRQALLLDEGNMDVMLMLRELETGDYTTEERMTYFTSYSDAPPPQRLQGVVESCGTLRGIERKKADEIFPDIEELEQQARRQLETVG